MPNSETAVLSDIAAEAGIISSLIKKPDLFFSSENLKPKNFFNMENGFLYWAIGSLVQKGVEKIDAFNITMSLEANKHTAEQTKTLTPQTLNELIEMSNVLSRDSVEEYTILVDRVLDLSFRRETLNKVEDCRRLILNPKVEDVQAKVYSEIESVICDYQDIKPPEPLSKKIDAIWEEIISDTNEDNFIDFKFPSLNAYCKISRTDCVVFAAREKRGKSIILMNCVVDLLRKGQKVLVVDSELPSRLYTMRLLSHIAQVEFIKLRDRTFTLEENQRIQEAIAWLKTVTLIHEFVPVLTKDKLISVTKQAKHKFGVSVLVLDYLKGNGEHALDAFKNSAVLGELVDTAKNRIAASMDMFVLTAVQATASGAIADSAKIIRNCSSLLYLERKANDEIAKDGGLEFGNCFIKCVANRNGQLHGEGESISLTLDGNRCTFTESKQPIKPMPF